MHRFTFVPSTLIPNVMMTIGKGVWLSSPDRHNDEMLNACQHKDLDSLGLSQLIRPPYLTKFCYFLKKVGSKPPFALLLTVFIA